MAKEKRHHHKAHSAMKMDMHDKHDGKSGGKGTNKATMGYDSYAGKPSMINGLPNQSFISHWGSSPSFPSDRYPNGIDDIDGIEEMMMKMIKKQASDRLY
jgi:hypothetical protein